MVKPKTWGHKRKNGRWLWSFQIFNHHERENIRVKMFCLFDPHIRIFWDDTSVSGMFFGQHIKIGKI